jgi:hypothetical protein
LCEKWFKKRFTKGSENGMLNIKLTKAKRTLYVHCLQFKIHSCSSTSVILRCEHKVKVHAAEREKIRSRKTWRISCFVASQPTNHPSCGSAGGLC